MEDGWPVELVLGGALSGFLVVVLGVALFARRRRRRATGTMDAEHEPLPNAAEESDAEEAQKHQAESDEHSERAVLTASV